MGWFAHFGIVSKFQKKKFGLQICWPEKNVVAKKILCSLLSPASLGLGLSLAKCVWSETFFGPQN